MLLVEFIGITEKGELIVLSAPSPNDLTGFTVDLGDLIHTAAGEKDIPVMIDRQCIRMHIIDTGFRKIHSGGIKDIELAITEPLKDKIIIFVILLNKCADSHCK